MLVHIHMEVPIQLPNHPCLTTAKMLLAKIGPPTHVSQAWCVRANVCNITTAHDNHSSLPSCTWGLSPSSNVEPSQTGCDVQV